MSLSILGTGSALPSHVVTNDDLAKFLDTSDEWIRTRTGIGQRHIALEENMQQLVLTAATAAMEMANTKPEELDYILCCTLGGDYLFPSASCMLQAQIGASCPALDLNAACSGFIYGLDVAAGLFAAGRAKRILMVGLEGLSRITDWTDRRTAVLFGDGAGAVVLGTGDAMGYIHVEASGNDQVLRAPFPMGNYPERSAPVAPSFTHMDGAEVYKFAVSAIARCIENVLTHSKLAPEDIDHVLLHQANLRIIEAAKRRLGIPGERFPTNIERVGNMSAASIPVLLDEEVRAGHIKKNDQLVLCAFGGGLTCGAVALRWDI